MKLNTRIVYAYDSKTRPTFDMRLISCTDKGKGKPHP